MVKKPITQKPPAKDVFISYARDESSADATALWKSLSEKGVEAFLDTEDIKYRERFPDRIIDGIFGARVTVLFVGPKYLERRYCILERRLALVSYTGDISLSPEFDSTWKREPDEEATRSVVVALCDTKSQNALKTLLPDLQRPSWPNAWDTKTLAERVFQELEKNKQSLSERLGKRREAVHRQEFREEIGVSPASTIPKKLPHFPSPLPQSSKSFSGRSQEIYEVDNMLKRHGRVSICAGAGFGKTRLAIEYVHRYAPDHYSGGIFWINADADEIVMEDRFYGIARALRESMPKRASEQPIPDLLTLRAENISIRELLRSELKAAPLDRPLLLVFDNLPETVNDAESLRIGELVAGCDQVSILATSREIIRVDGLVPLPLLLLEPESAVALLIFNVPRRYEISLDNWRTIARWAGHFPLALDLLNHTLCGTVRPSSVLDAARNRGSPADSVDQLSKEFRSSFANEMVASTISGIIAALRFSFDRLPDAAKRGAELLARFGPYSIPELLYKQLPSEGMTHKALVDLETRNFLMYPYGKSIGTMHAVLVEFIRDLNRDDKNLLVMASNSLRDALKQVGFTMNPSLWPELNECCVHSEDMLDRGLKAVEGDREQIECLLEGYALATRIQSDQIGQAAGNHMICEEMRKKALTQCEKYLGHLHSLTIMNRYLTAAYLDERGDKAEAMRMALQSLSDARAAENRNMINTIALWVELRQPSIPRDREANLEIPDPSSYALHQQVVSLIGDSVLSWERWRFALSFTSEIIERYRGKLGNDHEWTLDIMNLTASYLSTVGHTQKARDLLILARNGRVASRKIDRADQKISSARMNLAYAIDRLGDLEGAEAEVRKALANRRRYLGKDHPETWEAEAFLADLRTDGGFQVQAIRTFRRLAKLAGERLGPLHTGTLRRVGDLQSALMGQGKLKEAAAIVDGTLASLRKADAAIDLVAEWCKKSAIISRKLGDYQRALELHRESVRICEEEPELGRDSPVTLDCKKAMAISMRLSGDIEGAFGVESEVLEGWRCLRGDRSPDAGLAMVRLAKTARLQRDGEFAVSLVAEAREIATESVGPQHPLWEQLNKLAEV